MLSSSSSIRAMPCHSQAAKRSLDVVLERLDAAVPSPLAYVLPAKSMLGHELNCGAPHAMVGAASNPSLLADGGKHLAHAADAHGLVFEPAAPMEKQE